MPNLQNFALIQLLSRIVSEVLFIYDGILHLLTYMRLSFLPQTCKNSNDICIPVLYKQNLS